MRCLCTQTEALACMNILFGIGLTWAVLCGAALLIKRSVPAVDVSVHCYIIIVAWSTDAFNR